MEKTKINAKIIADSLFEGSRLTTFVVEFPRIVLAELNTHRAFCLDGDTEIYIEKPSAVRSNKKSIHQKIKIKELFDKWENGTASRRNYSFSIEDEGIELDKSYTAKELSDLYNISLSSIRRLCQRSLIQTENPDKKRNEDHLILGSVFKDYINKSKNKQSCKKRLKGMNLRCLNEKTLKFETTKIKDCIKSGVKEVYEITLEDGKKIS